MLGADPDEDNYLYQIWIFYELADLLRAEGCLDYLDTRPASTELRFHWGAGTELRSYQLLHDQGIDRHWDNAPGIRPDYYVRRMDRIEVRAAGAKAPIWHEAGYVLDAKYYKPRSGSRAPGNPVKRMIADLHLAGERRGALLFAFQRSSSTKSVQLVDQELEPDTEGMSQQVIPLYQVTPARTTAFAVQPDVQIAIWRVLPESADDARAARSTLMADSCRMSTRSTLVTPIPSVVRPAVNCWRSARSRISAPTGSIGSARAAIVSKTCRFAISSIA